MTTYYTRIDSPIESLLLASDGESLTSLFMMSQRHGPYFSDAWILDTMPSFLPKPANNWRLILPES
jgi:hypothetical protein